MEGPISRRFSTGAAVGAVALVLTAAAGAANGGIRPDDRGPRGPGAVAQSNQWAAGESAARPDDRSTHGPGAIEAARRDIVLRPDDRGDRPLPSSVPLAQPTRGEAFDWVDAGIGSAATLGLVLLVAGVSVMRLRQVARAT